MTQRAIVTYLSLKGMSAREIHDDIVATLGPYTFSEFLQFCVTLQTRCQESLTLVVARMAFRDAPRRVI
jgi:hypothetical protein